MAFQDEQKSWHRNMELIIGHQFLRFIKMVIMEKLSEKDLTP